MTDKERAPFNDVSNIHDNLTDSDQSCNLTVAGSSHIASNGEASYANLSANCTSDEC